MLSTRSAWVWALTASCCSLLACGGKSQTEQWVGGEGASGGASAAGADNGSGGRAVAGGSTGGSFHAAAGANQCEGYDDSPALAVGILIRNETERTLHVGQRAEPCTDAPLFEVRRNDGELVVPPGYCRVPCESQMSDNPTGGCNANCPGGHSLTLRPGESHRLFWDALYQVQAVLPKGCYPNHPDHDLPTLACDKTQRITPGAYLFTVLAGTVLECYAGSPNCTPCTPNETGGCTTQQTWVGGKLTVAEVSVNLDASYGLSPSGGLSIGINEVQIVFKD